MLPVPPVRMLAVRKSDGGRDESWDKPMALDSVEGNTSGACIFALAGAASGFSVLKVAWVKASKGVGWGSIGSDWVLLPTLFA